jgi:hypothetical protein
MGAVATSTLLQNGADKMPFKDPIKRREYHREATRRFREKNPERARELGRISDRKRYHKRRAAQKIYQLEWQRKNRIKNRLYSVKWLYGLTPVEYDRLYQVQQGACAICHRHQTDIKRTLQVDHCHKTGRVRGLLCLQCNLYVGAFERGQNLTVAVLVDQIKKYLDGPNG